MSLAKIYAGKDVVINAATGAGKGLLIQVPAVAMWAAAVSGIPEPVTLVLVPYKALGEHLERSFNFFLERLRRIGGALNGRFGRALFVRRMAASDGSGADDTAEDPTKAADVLLTEVVLEKKEEMEESEVEISFPCGVCAACRAPGDFTAKVIAEFEHRCMWTCRTVYPNERWCKFCMNRPSQPSWVKGCQARKGILLKMATGIGACATLKSVSTDIATQRSRRSSIGSDQTTSTLLVSSCHPSLDSP